VGLQHWDSVVAVVVERGMFSVLVVVKSKRMKRKRIGRA
jgi:hypothetical protein